MTDLQVGQLAIMARLYPDGLGYADLDGGGELTFGEWNQRANRLARGLAALGVEPGDRVAIYLPNEEFLDWIVAYPAIHKAGAVAVPVNTRLTDRELATILGHAGVRVAITDATFAAHLEGVRAEVPSLTTVIQVPLDASGVLDPDGSDVQVPVDEGDLADIMYTSGTTGTPKGVAVRHRSLALLPNGEVPFSGKGWLHSSPPFTFAGIAFVYNPMKLGMSGLYQARFDAGRWLEYVERWRPQAAFIVPSFAQLLVTHPRWDDADLSSLELVSCGSAPLAPDTLVKLCTRLDHATVTNGYGMTEAGPAFCAIGKEDVLRRIGSVGKPMPPMEVRVVPTELGGGGASDGADDLPAGEHGEILVRARGREREYYRDPEATARTWTPDGWLHTGDIGYLDDDGFLYIVGRMKDVIIRGGNNIHATDVESVLMEHPGILEAAVVGVPHEVLGEDVAAFVVAVPGAELDPEEVEAFCRARLTDYKCPRRITVVDHLPRNPTGKVLKHELPVETPAAAANPKGPSNGTR